MFGLRLWYTLPLPLTITHIVIVTAHIRGAIVKLHIDFQTGNSHSGPRCYRAFALQSKNYKSLLVTTFKLEQWMHYGPVILGAFASKSSSEIGLFHTLCKEMMKRHKCGLRHYLEKERNDDIDVQSKLAIIIIKVAKITAQCLLTLQVLCNDSSSSLQVMVLYTLSSPHQISELLASIETTKSLTNLLLHTCLLWVSQQDLAIFCFAFKLLQIVW